MTFRRWIRKYLVGIIAIIVSVVVFLVPFAFVVLQAAKDPREAGLVTFSLPTEWQFWPNLVEVLQKNDYQVLLGVRQQRRPHRRQLRDHGGASPRWSATCCSASAPGSTRSSTSSCSPRSSCPPPCVPTIWVLQGVGLFKTLPGMILIEATFGLAFCVLLFRAFVATIPKELDEAAIIDGAGPIRLFFGVVLPLLKPVIVTVIVVQAVFVFNDFQSPLYFLPGSDNPTVQLGALQLPEPIGEPVQPAVHVHPAHHDPAADHVHLLQPADRRGHDQRSRQGLRQVRSPELRGDPAAEPRRVRCRG